MTMVDSSFASRVAVLADAQVCAAAGSRCLFGLPPVCSHVVQLM